MLPCLPWPFWLVKDCAQQRLKTRRNKKEKKHSCHNILKTKSNSITMVGIKGQETIFLSSPQLPGLLRNIGTFNGHELFWMLQNNRTKNLLFPSYISTNFCAKLSIAVHEWKCETLCTAESILTLFTRKIINWKQFFSLLIFINFNFNQ